MKRKGHVWGWFWVFFLLLTQSATAQYVKIGEGSYAGTLGGPMVASTSRDTQTSRFAYIIPKSALGNMIHLDTLTSIEFYRVSGSAPNTSTDCKIWLNNTSRGDFGTGKLHFPTESNNAQLVFSGSPSSYIGGTEKFYKIPLNNKPYVFDTTLGDNLVLLVEYSQTKKQNSVLQWYFEGPATVSAYALNQVKYGIGISPIDSLPSSSSYHPTMIFNYPKFNQDLAIIKVYTLGKIPLPLGKPDSVQALVRNVGKKTISGFPVYTNSIGYNKQKDSFQVTLLPGEELFVNVPSLNPLNGGLDSIYVTCKDKNNSNNSGVSFRLGNPNVYSYRDVTLSPAPGGIGFNGTTGDFVARFFSNSPKYINQVTVAFGSGGEPFKVGIWRCDSITKKPGTLIYQSDSLTSKAGNYILDFKKPVAINGSFFVGVRQLGTSNVAFGYQTETPVRPKTFYYVEPLGTTNWVDFAPDAPFKFLIEPRLQADIDVAAISIDQPRDSINKYNKDTIAPEGIVGNIGVQNAKDSFDIRCEIWFGANKQYAQTIRDTLSSGQKRKYTFPRTFIPSAYGEHKVWLIVKKLGDQVSDNDTQTRFFYVGVKRDVMINSVYEPGEGSGYNYKTDTIMPMANIQNVGYDNSPTFTVRCRMFQGTKVVYNQTQFLTLPKFQSKILFWPTYKCSDTGKIKVVFTTEMATDAYKPNDTQSRTIFIRKIVDIGIDSLTSPSETTFHKPGSALPIKYFIYNDGLVAAFNVPFYCAIYGPGGNRLYYDSVKAYLQGLFGTYLTMPKNFTPSKLGQYKLVVKTRYNLDLFNENDSMVRYFNVGKPHDFKAIEIKRPSKGEVVSIGKPSIAPKFAIQNLGYLKNTGPAVCEVFYKGNRIYYDIKNITLDTGKTDTVVFAATLRPMNVGEFTIRCYANLGSDLDRSNDTLVHAFNAVVGRDAYPMAVRTFNDSSTFDLSDTLQWADVTIENQGADSIRKVLVNISIFENGQRTAFVSQVTQLAGKQVGQLRFNLQHRFSRVGIANLLVYTSSFEDQNIFNDSLWKPLNIALFQDLKLIKAAQPDKSSKLVKNDSIRYPRVQYTNVGQKNPNYENRIIYQVSQPSSGKVLFLDTLSVGSINVGDTAWTSSTKALTFSEAGAYLMTCFLEQSKDGVTSNDTLQYILFVEEAVNTVDLACEWRIYPNPANDVLEIQSRHSDHEMHLELVDVNGRLVYQESFTNSIHQINTKAFASGFYALKLHSEKESITRSIVICHP